MDASDEARLRWIRRFYLRSLPVAHGVYVVGALTAEETWQYVLLAAAALSWLCARFPARRAAADLEQFVAQLQPRC